MPCHNRLGDVLQVLENLELQSIMQDNVTRHAKLRFFMPAAAEKVHRSQSLRITKTDSGCLEVTPWVPSSDAMSHTWQYSTIGSRIAKC